MSTGTTPLCGYCGRPICGDSRCGSDGLIYHPECTHGPGYVAPCYGAVNPPLADLDYGRLLAEVAGLKATNERITTEMLLWVNRAVKAEAALGAAKEAKP